MIAAPHLADLQRIKRWMRAHKTQQPLEYHCFDAVLTLWMLGAIGWMPAVVLDQELWAWPLCLLAWRAPALYLHWRAQAHASGRLRCDWLALVPSATVRS